MKFEALHERRIQLAGFCKLVVYNILPIKSAAPLYRHYIHFHGEFGDIMKSTLGKLREINRTHTAKMVVYCLQLGFNELQAACQVRFTLLSHSQIQIIEFEIPQFLMISILGDL